VTTKSTSSAVSGNGSRWIFVEEVVGRVLLILWFAFAVVLQLRGTWAQVTAAQPDFLEIAKTILALTFSGLIVALTTIRRAPIAIASGWMPRVAAFLGTFLIIGMPALPAGQIGPFWSSIAIALMLVGLLSSVYSLAWLGRSFAVMATARKLVTGGPYGIVRNPLYACEMVTILGVVIANFSFVAVLFGLATLALLCLRTIYEERILAATFPEYAEYAERVPRIIPRIFPQAVTA